MAAYVIGASKKRIMFKQSDCKLYGTDYCQYDTEWCPNAIFTKHSLHLSVLESVFRRQAWGTMANDARSLFRVQPIQIIWPVLAICLTMLSLNFIGDGLSEALDPIEK